MKKKKPVPLGEIAEVIGQPAVIAARDSGIWIIFSKNLGMEVHALRGSTNVWRMLYREIIISLTR